jgi:septal ring factor EnvC (AmiA/AmiB activator)
VAIHAGEVAEKEIKRLQNEYERKEKQYNEEWHKVCVLEDQVRELKRELQELTAGKEG